ncbi:hypothetical protein L917_02670 [Phytophthora nicotianae]|uniref:RxLR effector protein n=3 Tax=Phytophthora nicotianae TaxID=4792 RepID=V9FT35_PHYNI|nr:hypothetical protein F443_02882 [Phytophthora nicotianae P1569]ETM00623.1 hypothetical protein L917_02670 [Phytophthora nicotianae]ETM53806.1 hypothetical protein L914_02751 [Phytophthora nicotianae]ETO83021.1 hypothetical protein F444_02893 [Phytophthora nicotianae P1976]
MRLHLIAVLVVVALVANAQATASKNHPKVLRLNSATDRSIIANIPVQRFLRKHHSVDTINEERGIVTVLEKAKTLVSTKVTDKTLQRWAANNKAPKHALLRLKLDDAGTELFKKAKFGEWVTFMTKRYPENAHAAMISALRTRYSDDVLSKMIIAAKQAPSTKNVATKLQVEQLRAWGKQGKSADDVFALLNLKTKAQNLDDLFDDPQFVPWLKYVDDFNKNDPVKANAMMRKTLAPHTNGADIGAKLQAQQLKVWAREGKTADDAFNLFNLKTKAQSLDDLVQDAQFFPWIKYVGDLNDGDSKKKYAMVAKTLTTYNDETNKGVYTMLNAAKNQELAKKLQRGQFDNWLADNVKFYDVSTYVGAKGSPPNSPARKFVQDYLQAYNKKNIP